MTYVWMSCNYFMERKNMSNFYTNAMVNGDQIFVRGVENGKKFIRKEDFFPTMYLKSKKESDWKTLFNESVEEMKPGSIRDTRRSEEHTSELQSH